MNAKQLLPNDTISRYVGQTSFSRGRAYANKRLVSEIVWDAEDGLLAGCVQGSRNKPYETLVQLRRMSDKTYKILSSSCSCPVGSMCKHVAALLLSGREKLVDIDSIQEVIITTPTKNESSWRKELEEVFFHNAPETSQTDSARLGVQFEVIKRSVYEPSATYDYGRPVTRTLLGARPVVHWPQDTRWLLGGINWNRITRPYYAIGELDTRQVTWLRDFHTLYRACYQGWYQDEAWVFIDFLGNETLWPLMKRAKDAGIRFITAQKDQQELNVLPEPATPVCNISTTKNGGLLLSPTLQIGSGRYGNLGFIGVERAVGFYSWQENGKSLKQAELVLGRLNPALEQPLLDLVARGKTTKIPKEGVEEFKREVYPKLVQKVSMIPTDSTVNLPELIPPELVVRIEPGEKNLQITLGWLYQVDGHEYAMSIASVANEPIARDYSTEQDILENAKSILLPFPEMFKDGHLQPMTVLTGVVAATWAKDALPKLKQVEGIAVQITNELPTFEEVTEEPEITFGTTDTDERDWFDLHVQVNMGRHEVPIEQLLLALANDESYLMLENGAYFALDRAEFTKLRELLLEARKLQDTESGQLKLSRFQAGLWGDLVSLGVVGEQADKWRQVADGLSQITNIEKVHQPTGLTASLRPYQAEGYQWLNFLWRHGLGGILADDMGLGKTIQTIAVVTRVLEQAETKNAPPWLIIAPTSVAPNWLAEFAKFAPDVRAVNLDQTTAKRGESLSEAIQNTHVVITSYTLLRLDAEEYLAQEWGGVVIDEAQFVKNHQSKAYQCVRKLRCDTNTP